MSGKPSFNEESNPVTGLLETMMVMASFAAAIRINPARTLRTIRDALTVNGHWTDSLTGAVERAHTMMDEFLLEPCQCGEPEAHMLNVYAFNVELDGDVVPEHFVGYAICWGNTTGDMLMDMITDRQPGVRLEATLPASEGAMIEFTEHSAS
jgi:hypothetical protein